ncbi:MAG TPA: hypothetical protein DDX98_12835 [Bacteroidales bacterium]|nr:hypothetical protein [Bacteroidales bacterium]
MASLPITQAQINGMIFSAIVKKKHMTIKLLLISILLLTVIILLLGLKFFNKKKTSLCSINHEELPHGSHCEVCGVVDKEDCLEEKV